MARKKKMRWYDWLAFVLLVIGGLNWGLVGWFGIDLVQVIAFTAGIKFLATLIYSLVAVSGGYGAYTFVRLARR